MVPDSLIRNLDPVDLKLFTWCDRVQGRGGRPAAGYRRIAKKIGLHAQTVKNAAHRLADLGIIVIEQSGHKQPVLRVVHNGAHSRFNPDCRISTDSTPERRSGLAPKAAPDPGVRDEIAQGTRRGRAPDSRGSATKPTTPQVYEGVDRSGHPIIPVWCEVCGEEATGRSTLDGTLYCEDHAPFENFLRASDFGASTATIEEQVAEAARWEPPSAPPLKPFPWEQRTTDDTPDDRPPLDSDGPPYDVEAVELDPMPLTDPAPPLTHRLDGMEPPPNPRRGHAA